jgi:ElaB/YqjD/DUF883 family membrane-anchored ribosome-binding protein
MSFITTYDDDYSVDTNSRFAREDGAYQLMTEAISFEEEMTLTMLKADYLEARAIKESASEEEIESLREGTVGDVVTKVKNFFIKIGKKIKAFIYGWIARIHAKFASDNKAFYNKYKDKVNGKDDLEVEYCQPNDVGTWANFDADACLNSLLTSYNLKKTDTSDIAGELSANFDKDAVANAGMKAYCTSINNIELKTCKKDMEDAAWKSTSKDKEKFSSIRSDVEKLLQNGDDKLKVFKKAADDADKTCKSQAGAVAIKHGKAASRFSSVATAFSKIVITANGAAMSIYKEQLSQARSVYAKAVQYKPKY